MQQLLPQALILTCERIEELLLAGKATSQVADQLGLKASTVSTLKHRILDKLTVNCIPELIQKATVYKLA